MSRHTRGTEPRNALQFRRNLRASSTPAERQLWSVLRMRRRGVKFRRQHSIAEHIVNFVCLEAKLIVELVGQYHDHQVEKDLDRQKQLEALGYRVFRYTNEDVLHDLEAVARGIDNALSGAPSP